MLHRIIILSFFLFSCLAFAFDEETLVSDQQTWKVETIDKKTKMKIKITLSFMGVDQYEEDMEKGRIKDPAPGFHPLRGYQIINLTSNKTIPKDCPFPRVVVEPIEGYLDDEMGRMVFYAVTAVPISGRAGTSYNSAGFIEIYDIHGKEAKVTLSELAFTSSKEPFHAERNKGLKAIRVK